NQRLAAARLPPGSLQRDLGDVEHRVAAYETDPSLVEAAELQEGAASLRSWPICPSSARSVIRNRVAGPRRARCSVHCQRGGVQTSCLPQASAVSPIRVSPSPWITTAIAVAVVLLVPVGPSPRRSAWQSIVGITGPPVSGLT